MTGRRVARGIAVAAACVAALAAAPAAAHAQTHVLIVSGLGGEAQYVQEFARLASTLATAAHERYGIPDSSIVWLGERRASSSPRFRGESTKENIERELGRLARSARPNDQVLVVLIGHGGGGEGPESRIAIPGPDLNAADFARLLAAFPTQPIAFVNLASASGDMLGVLSGERRVVITATKTAFERNESQFARFFVDALTADVADVDKDGRVSLAEAFQYALAEQERFYETDGRLRTEHAQIADGGILSRRFFLGAGSAAQASTDPRLAALYAEQNDLEEQIERLRQRKADMSEAAYDAELERLVLALARKTQEIRALEPGGGR